MDSHEAAFRVLLSCSSARQGRRRFRHGVYGGTSPCSPARWLRVLAARVTPDVGCIAAKSAFVICGSLVFALLGQSWWSVPTTVSTCKSDDDVSDSGTDPSLRSTSSATLPFWHVDSVDACQRARSHCLCARRFTTVASRLPPARVKARHASTLIPSAAFDRRWLAVGMFGPVHSEGSKELHRPKFLSAPMIVGQGRAPRLCQ